MVQTLQCPNCHASLDYEDTNASTIRCPYCRTTVIVPEELRGTPGAARGGAGIPFQAGFDLSALHVQRLRQIGELVRSGKKLEAIKLFRETFGTGLKESKDAVEQLERGEPIQLTQMPTPTMTTFSSTTLDTTPTVTVSGGSRVGCVVMGIILMVLLIGGAVTYMVLSTTKQITDQVSQVIPQINISSTVEFDTTSIQSTIAAQIDDQLGELGDLGVSIQPTLPPNISPTPGFAQVTFSFGQGEGEGPGYFNDSRSIGLDADGNIYVGDYTGGRVQVFNSQGTFITQWFADRDAPMTSMTADRDGVVYIVQRGDIVRYDGQTGEALGTFAAVGGAGFQDIATTLDGGLVGYAFTSSDQLIRYDSNGQEMWRVDEVLTLQTGSPESLARLAVDGGGNIYILGQTFSRVVFKFDADGRFITRIGTEGEQGLEAGQLDSPNAIAVDYQGRVFVEDFDGIEVFTTDGRFLDIIHYPVPSSVSFDMVFNDQNQLFTIDRNGNQVMQFTINGN